MTVKQFEMPTAERADFQIEQRTNFYAEMIQQALNNMDAAAATKFRWSLNLEYIISEMQDDFMDEVTILHDNKFEMVFVKEENVLELRTTKSNQLIDEDYMRKLMALSQNQSLLESALKVLNSF